MKVNEIIEKLEYVANNPQEMLAEYVDKGYKTVGCFPVFCPEEIVDAAGMVPIGIWGGKIDIMHAKEYFPAFATSLVQTILEYGIRGDYDKLSAVIIPAMSDTLITLTQNWKSAVKHIPMIGIVYPQNRFIEPAIEYLASEYELVREKLEEIIGHKITDEDLDKSIRIYNEHRDVMREFVEITPNYLVTLSPTKRNAVIKSARYMRKEEHTALMKELIAGLKAMPKEDFKGKKVLVTGIVLDDRDVLEIFEENNLAVAWDNLASESVQFMKDVPKEGKNPIDRLARQWSLIEGCSLAYDPKKKRGQIIAEDVKRLGLDGVIFAMLGFSDYEEYDYPIFKKDMEKANIPQLVFEVEMSSPSLEQLRTRIQTFAEIL